MRILTLAIHIILTPESPVNIVAALYVPGSTINEEREKSQPKLAKRSYPHSMAIENGIER